MPWRGVGKVVSLLRGFSIRLGRPIEFGRHAARVIDERPSPDLTAFPERT